jgi:hypothetical protein
MCKAWHGYRVTSAHQVEVGVSAGGLVSAPPPLRGRQRCAASGRLIAPIYTAIETIDRLTILVAVHRFFGIGAAASRNIRLCSVTIMSACMTFPSISIHSLRRLRGDIRREFMQIFVVLYGALSSYLWGALTEESADAIACLHFPRT